MLIWPKFKYMPRAKKTDTTSVTATKKKTTKRVAKVVEETPLETTSFRRPDFRNKKMIAAVALIAGVGLLAFLASKYLVVAWVDNKPITRLELLSELNKQYGKDTREQLIVKSLIASEASSKGLTVADSDIDAEIKKIEEQQGGAEQLSQALQMQGISNADFRELVRLQILRQKLFSGGEPVTDAEVERYIEENKTQLPEAIDDKLKASIKDELAQQRIAATYSAWLKDALSGGRVKRI